jgi:hypothetical protein
VCHIPLHLIDGREPEFVTPERREPQRADLRRRDVHEPVVEAGEAQVRDARVQDVPVKLRAVVGALEQDPQPVVEERQARRPRADREHHDVGGQRLTGGQLHAAEGQTGDLGLVRLDGAGCHVPVVAGRSERGGRAQVRQEVVLGQDGVEAGLTFGAVTPPLPAGDPGEERLQPGPERAYEPAAPVQEPLGGGGVGPKPTTTTRAPSNRDRSSRSRSVMTVPANASSPSSVGRCLPSVYWPTDTTRWSTCSTTSTSSAAWRARMVHPPDRASVAETTSCPRRTSNPLASTSASG